MAMGDLTSRKRVEAALERRAPDQVPLDLGGCSVTGMHASSVCALRQALGLDPPGAPVKVWDPFQMLGEIGDDLIEALGIDVVPLMGTGTFFGFRLERWKPWRLPDGTPVLVPGDFNTEPEEDGRLYQYPQGDRAAKPSGVMPQGGFYFEAIDRGEAPDFGHLRIEDNLEEFGPIPDDELNHLAREAERLHRTTTKAIFASFPGGGFGDMAWLPGPFLRRPRGIRRCDDWLVGLLERPDFVRRLFERQCAIALENLSRLYDAVGDRVGVLFLSGADYGTQKGPFFSPRIFAELFVPFYRRLTGWIHENTRWKAFLHSCGAVEPFIGQFVEAGFDVLHPVQCSAAGMDPAHLKEAYGRRIAFWGGGVDTQRTLPFGTPGEVRREVRERIRIFGEGGGYVFAPVHNIQPLTPVENIIALLEAYRESCDRRVGRGGSRRAVPAALRAEQRAAASPRRESMTPRERLDAAFALEPVDRIPALGGWIADPGKVMALTGTSEDEYWSDPVPISIEAYRRLGLDGLLDVNVPSERGGYTLVTAAHMAERARHQGPESIVDDVERLPAPEEVMARFDEEGECRKMLGEMRRMQELCGSDLYWCPARWEVVPNFEWYRIYGYENYLLAIGLYPEHIVRLYRHSAAEAGCRARVVARLVREGLHPRAMLCGQDICGSTGPMVSPGFLREHYFPLVADAIRPLRQAGAKLVWHCDGDVRPILDDILGLGCGGLQGFQEELGVRLEDIVERRTVDGEKLLIFGPISVAVTLNRETPDGVRRAVREAVRICEGKASLVLFTSNEILPDVPLENLFALYEAIRNP